MEKLPNKTKEEIAKTKKLREDKARDLEYRSKEKEYKEKQKN